MDDVNADLIGYTLETQGDPPAQWIVQGTDPVCGANYVLMHRAGTDGSAHYDKRICGANIVRRRKQIDEGPIARGEAI
jgi:hypothetical protein